MRKEVEEIAFANSKEGDNTSTDDLLKKLIEVNEKQNELLSGGNKSSNTLNSILMFFSGITLIFALASIQIASLQLEGDKYPLGETIFYFVFFYAMILVIILGIMLIRDAYKDKNHPIITNICNIILALLIIPLIILPLILIILGIFPQLNQITFIVIVSVIYGVICGVVYVSKHRK